MCIVWSAAVCAIAGTARSQDTAGMVVEWVRHNSTPLEMPAIGAMIGEAPLVGLGEGTHGTREFYLFKDQLIEYLVSTKGFRAIAFEGNFAAVMALDDYVVNGRGTPESAVAALDGFNWETEEVTALLKWVRAYNLDAKHTQKVRFYGIDVENGYPSIEGALRFIASRDSAAAQRLTRPFVSLLHLDLSTSGSPQGRFDDFNERLMPGQHDILVAATEAVADYLDRNSAALGDTAPGSAWAIAREHATIAVQRARDVRTIEGWYSSLGMARSDSLYGRAGADATALLDFLGAHDASLKDTVSPLLTALEHPHRARVSYVREMTQDQRVTWQSLADLLIARLQVEHTLDPERAAAGDWDAALRRADEMRDILRDFQEFFARPLKSDFEPRDPAMAENVAWAVRQGGPNAKVIVWAHDAHVSASPYAPGTETMGSALRKRFGDRYLPIGTLFNRGGFQARLLADSEPIRVFTVEPATPGSIEGVLAEAHLPALALDLRRAPANTAIRAWFANARPARFIGNGYNPANAAAFYQVERIADMFDIIVYFDQTTRARPIPEAAQKFHIGDS